MGRHDFTDSWHAGDTGSLLVRSDGEPKNFRRSRACWAEFMDAHWESNGNGDKARTSLEDVLARLAPRHAIVLRRNLAVLRASLQGLALLPVGPVVQAVLQVEWLLHAASYKKHYRDHVGHVLKTAHMGLFFLEGRPNLLGSNLDDSLLNELLSQLVSPGTDFLHPAIRRRALCLGVESNDMDKPEFWKTVVREAVLVAGLLHDVAHPLKLTAHLQRALASVDAIKMEDELTRGRALRMVRENRRTLLFAPFFEMQQDERTRAYPSADEGKAEEMAAQSLMNKHGMRAGAAILEFGRQADSIWRLAPQEKLIIEWAAMAAGLHDFDKEYQAYCMDDIDKEKCDAKAKENGLGEDPDWKPAHSRFYRWLCGAHPGRLFERTVDVFRPSFRLDPVSYILALCDQLQDFGRMTYSADKASVLQNHPPLRLLFPWKATTVSREGARLEVGFELGDSLDLTNIYGIAKGQPPAIQKEHKEWDAKLALRGGRFTHGATSDGKVKKLKPTEAGEAESQELESWLRHDGLGFDKKVEVSVIVPATP